MTKQSELQPLQQLLDSVVARLETLETKVGVAPPSTARSHQAAPPPAIPTLAEDVDSDSTAVKAYDTLLEASIAPLTAACDALGGMKNMGQLLHDAWKSIRTIIILASRAKMPADVPTELQPHLQSTQKAVQDIRALRLDRAFDDHCKAIIESLACLSWILIKPPPQTPAAFVKEAIGSTDFWSNRIRKQYKGKDDKQIAFCDALKKSLNDLVVYITQNHITGLTWNPRGVSLAEAAIMLSEAKPSPTAHAAKTKPGTPASPRHRRVSLVSGGAGSTMNLMAELEKKRTADGSSAATGLKKVSRDQQTWRKEYKGEKSAVVTDKVAAPKKQEAPHKKKLTGLPICEYQERGHKWVVEHQTKESCGGKVLKVQVSDPKQQVYIFSCQDVTVQVEGGKLKSVILDKCQRCNVVFETAISACEMVNCKKIQVQTTGVCPSFSIDKTEGCLVYLSKESMEVTSFVTCQSTEMNVSFPDGDEQKELPIPEQFLHKVVGGAVASEVSDLYH